MSSKRDLGGMGESYFAHLCNEVGLVPTRIQQDKTGWDYFVEFPNADNVLGQPAAACRVQVKATDREDNFVDKISLHNWHRLATEPSPAFFCVLRYSGDRLPSAAYLVHVDEGRITAVLKRLRTLERDNASKPLSRTRRLRWTEQARLSAVCGEALKAAMVEQIGDLYEYSRKKMELVQGLQGPQITTEFTVEATAPDGMHPHEMMVELALNLRDTVPAKFTRLVESRFGVVLDRMSRMPGSQGQLSISRVPKGETMISFRSRKAEARFQCIVYNPLLVFPFIDPKYVRFRFDSPYVRFVTRPPDQMDFTILETIDAGPIRLADAVEVAKLVAITHSPDAFEIVLGTGETSQTISCTPHEPKTDLWSNLAYTIECAWRVVRAFDLSTDILVTMDQLRREQERLRVLGSLVLRPKTVPNTLNCVVEEPTEFQSARAVGIPYVAGAAVGDRFIVGAFALHGVPSISAREDGSWDVEVKNAATELVTFQVHQIGMEPGSVAVGPVLEAARCWLEHQEVAVLPYLGGEE